MRKWIIKHWGVIFPVLFILFGVCGQYFTTKRHTYITEHGVWTIYELGYVSFAPRGGLMASIYYKYKENNYRSGTGVSDEVGLKGEGRRFFMVLMPEKPAKKIVLYSRYPVPSWFTLDAPPKGWPTKPTETELREMMVQDSIKRGLK